MGIWSNAKALHESKAERKALGRCWAPGKRSTHRQIIVVFTNENGGLGKVGVQFRNREGSVRMRAWLPRVARGIEGKNGEMNGGGGRPAAKPIYAPKTVEALHGATSLASLVP